MPYSRNQYSELACKTEQVAYAHVKVLAFSFITCCLSSSYRIEYVCYTSCLLCCASIANYLLSDWEGNATKCEVGFIFLLFLINHQKAFWILGSWLNWFVISFVDNGRKHFQVLCLKLFEYSIQELRIYGIVNVSLILVHDWCIKILVSRDRWFWWVTTFL